ncbi:MAG: mRNA surveillance protein pelota [Candidatus Thorarchaeota archaeon]
MKVLDRALREGRITLQIETLDDLWHFYNIVEKGDKIVSRTLRRVRVGDEDSRKQESVRRPMTLALDVEDISFNSFSNRVRVKGRILEGPEDLVSIGTHHTFNVELGTVVTITKTRWPEYILKRIEEAERARSSGITLLVTIDDDEAHLHLVADFGIREAVSMRGDVTRKRGDQKTYDSTMREFFQEVAGAIRSQVEQHSPILIVIAGPGFVRNHFTDYLRTTLPQLPRIVTEGTSTVGLPAVKEILGRGVISSALGQLRIETENKLVDELLVHIAKDDGLGLYGTEEVEMAIHAGAVRSLLVTDKLLRESDEEQRRALEEMIHEAEKTRAEVTIISVDHPAGDQLQRLGGLAAIARYSIERG